MYFSAGLDLLDEGLIALSWCNGITTYLHDMRSRKEIVSKYYRELKKIKFYNVNKKKETDYNNISTK